METFYRLQFREIWQYIRGERAAYLFILFYMFLEYVRPQSLYPQIDIIPFAQLSIVGALAAAFLGGENGWVRNAENKLIVLFLAVVALSSVYAFRPEESFAAKELFLSWFVVYFLIINIVNTEKRLFVFIGLFLLYNFKMSQHGFVSWASAGFAFRNWGVTGGPGWFHNSGEFGIEMCLFVPMAIYFMIAMKPYWSKTKMTLFALLPFTGIASIIATTSRGAVVGIAASLLWMVAQSKMKTKAFIAVAVIAGIAYLSIPPQFYARFESAGEDSTSVARLNRWKYGVEIMNQHPWLGIGFRNWESYYALHYEPDEPNGGWGLPHNIFVDAGSELGYPGLILYVLMILYTFANNIRTRRMAKELDNRFLYYTAAGLDAALIGFLISGSFVSVLYYPYFWINMSMTVALNNITRRQWEARAESPAAVPIAGLRDPVKEGS